MIVRRLGSASLIHEIIIAVATMHGDYCPCCHLRTSGDVGFEIGVPADRAGTRRHAVSCPRALAVAP